MNKAFITKYPSKVDNANLPYLGKFKLLMKKYAGSSPDISARSINLGFVEDGEVEVLGDNYLTDATLTTNKGKIANYEKGLYSTVITLNDADVTILLDKYNFTRIELGDSYPRTSNKTPDIEFDLEDLKYAPVSMFLVPNTSVTGDIANLFSTRLTEVNVAGTSVTGDIASLASPSLTKLITLHTSVTGDIASLANTKLTEYKGSCYGDLSKAPSTFNFIDGDGNLKWTQKRQNVSMISMLGHFRFSSASELDNFLIDQATCTAPIYMKCISVIGPRTSASDAAVEAIQNKGVTVTITNS